MWGFVLLCLLVISGSFLFEKHLFSYFLLVEFYVLVGVVVVGVQSSLFSDTSAFLLFLSVAVAESVLGLTVYVHSLRSSFSVSASMSV